MDTNEWRKRNVGLPPDAAKQADPDEEGRMPAEGGADGLNDVTSDGGGQRSEVGPPYDGSGDVQHGVEKELHRDLDKGKRR